VKVLDFLERNIKEAEKMRLLDAKTLAIVVFGAQLNDTAKHHVMRSCLSISPNARFSPNARKSGPVLIEFSL